MVQLKNDEDIKRLEESGFILGSLLKEIRPLAQEGTSLLELDAWAENFILKRKAKPAFKGYSGFPATLCLSLNEAVIHGIPSNYKLKADDVLSIDCGVNFNNYYTDAAITLAMPKVSKEVMKLLEVTELALYKGIEKAIVGNRIKDIGRAVSQEAHPYSYGIVYQYCGHGVGFSLHEEPNIPNTPEGAMRLKKGMVIAIEPMFNLGVAEVEVGKDKWTVLTKDKKVSAHFEHTVAITEKGNIILTKV